jgi:hypothetical protein
MADEIQTVYLFRTGTQVTSKNKEGKAAVGERGYLFMGLDYLYTIERRGGYVTLPSGNFECTMEQHKRLGKVFRVKAEGANGHNVRNNRGILAGILIHAASYPHHVEGCVAPGRTQINNGVGKSSEAMEALFTYCGGWGVGKKMMMAVDMIDEWIGF